MDSKTLKANAVNANQRNTSIESTLTAGICALADVVRKEHETLMEFLQVLEREKDAILSFSLMDIENANKEKEDIVKRITLLKTERMALMGQLEENSPFRDDTHRVFMNMAMKTILEIRTCLKRNSRLLSLSSVHVGSAIGRIVRAMGRTQPTYGKQITFKSILFSRRI